MQSLVFIDTETTGFDLKKCELIELAAIRVNKKKIKQEFTSLIKPTQEIPQEIIEITGISNEDVQNAPDLEKVRADFLNNFLKLDDILVAHNIEFDLSFLNQNNFNLKNKTIDTFKIAQIILPHLKSLSLQMIAEYFQLNHQNAHRALADVKVNFLVWQEMQKEVIKKYSPELLDKIFSITAKSLWSEKIFFEEINNFSNLTKKNILNKKIDHENDQNKINKKKQINLNHQLSMFEENNLKKEKPQNNPKEINLLEKNLTDLKITISTEEKKIIEDISSNITEIEKEKLSLWQFNAPLQEKIIIINLVKKLITKNPQQKITIAYPYLQQKNIQTLANKILEKNSFTFLDFSENFLCKEKLEKLLQNKSFSEKATVVLLKIFIALFKNKNNFHIDNFDFKADEKDFFYFFLSQEKGEVIWSKEIEKNQQEIILFIPHQLINNIKVDKTFFIEALNIEKILDLSFGINISSQKFKKLAEFIEKENFQEYANQKKEIHELLDGILFGFDILLKFSEQFIKKSNFAQSFKISTLQEESSEFKNLAIGFTKAKQEFEKIFPKLNFLKDELKKWQEFFNKKNTSGNLKFLTITSEKNIKALCSSYNHIDNFTKIINQSNNLILTAKNFVKDVNTKKPFFNFLSNNFIYKNFKSELEKTKKIILKTPQKKEGIISAEEIGEKIITFLENFSGETLCAFSSQKFTQNIYLYLLEEIKKRNKPLEIFAHLQGNCFKTAHFFKKNPAKQKILLLPIRQLEKFNTLKFDHFFLHKFQFDVQNDPLLKERENLSNNRFLEYSLPKAVFNFENFQNFVLNQSKSNQPTFYLADERILEDWGKYFWHPGQDSNL